MISKRKISKENTNFACFIYKLDLKTHRGYLLDIFKNFFYQNPYIGFFRRNFFLRLKAGIDRTFLGEFTNDAEIIIFRVFATKIVFVALKSFTVQ